VFNALPMTRRAWALFAAMGAVWGLPYLLIKVAVAELDPSVVVFIRLALSAAVLLPIARASGSLKRVRRRWRRLFLIASVGIVIPFLCIAYGEQHVTSSLAALLIAADPVFVVLLALVFDRSERAGGTQLIGLILGLVGVGVLFGLNVGGDALALLGGTLVLFAAVCYAFSALLVKDLADVPRLGSVSVTLTVAALLIAPFALVRLPQSLPHISVLASVVTLGLLCTAVAYIVYFSLIAEAGAARASLITYVNPAVAVLLGVLLLSEPLTLATILGFVLIVIGCGLSTGTPGPGRRTRQPRRIAGTGAELVEGRSP
jgi:drug/metabolite transporter (DMT)-like permease